MVREIVVKRERPAPLRIDRDSGMIPYCRCAPGAFTFDGAIGVYVHADPSCWKPSRRYYETALAAGVLKEGLRNGSSTE